MYVTLFSYFFYYKSSGVYFILLLLTTTNDFIIGHLIATSTKQTLKKLFVTLSICFNLGMLAYFKYTNFFAEMILNLVNKPFEGFAIFLPVGISFFTFQSLSYTIDVYRGNIQPLKRWLDYAFYVSFFPQLVAGPIVRAKDFIPQIHQPTMVTREMFGKGLFLIAIGLFKKAVISDYISSNFVDRIFDNPLLYSGIENLLGVYGYALQIYCDFSGYSDMAIGIALLLGYHFNINFNSPYKAVSITDFWRRWHISLSTWLRDYLYISLGGNRKGKIRTYINLLITMLLGGLWHGASLRFIIWGGLHGISLVLHKIYMKIFNIKESTATESSWWKKFFGIIITFHLVCFGWIFFRSGSIEDAFSMLTQITKHFHPELLLEIIKGYGTVLSFIAFGFLMHFTPKKWDEKAESLVIKSSLLVQALLIAFIIVIIFQVKSADVQPFIYFQF